MLSANTFFHLVKEKVSLISTQAYQTLFAVNRFFFLNRLNNSHLPINISKTHSYVGEDMFNRVWR